MKHLDLFSGIGGFALAASWVWGAEHEIHSFVEIDPFCRKVLKKHWPDVPIHDDIRSYKHDGTTIDLLTGGFPCQDISRAGKRYGIHGRESGLFFSMLQTIKSVRPKWVLAENVSALRSNGLNIVLKKLAEIGYDSEWHCVPAHAIGSPQVRDRVFVVANAVQSRTSGWRPGRVGGWCRRQGKIRSSCRNRSKEKNVQLWAEPGMGRVVDGLPNKVDRINSIGNAIVPQVVAPIMEAIRIIDGPNNFLHGTRGPCAREN